MEILYLVIPVGLLLLGLLVGGATERSHFRRLDEAEAGYRDILVNNLKTVPAPQTVTGFLLVKGHVVLATDYFKTFATSLRNLVGGRAKAAERLMIRARREAIVRMLAEARGFGASEVVNVRFEFVNVSMLRGRGGAMQVEILAWGTAIRRAA